MGVAPERLDALKDYKSFELNFLLGYTIDNIKHDDNYDWDTVKQIKGANSMLKNPNIEKMNLKAFAKVNFQKWDYKIIRVDLDKEYDQHKQSESKYTCFCGKHIKWRYVCKPARGNTSGVKYFGSWHLMQEAGLPYPLVKKICRIQNDVDSSGDKLLGLMQQGRGFPNSLFDSAMRCFFDMSLSVKDEDVPDVVNYLPASWFKQMRVCRRFDLPLYDFDLAMLGIMKSVVDKSIKAVLNAIKTEKLGKQRKSEKIREAAVRLVKEGLAKDADSVDEACLKSYKRHENKLQHIREAREHKAEAIERAALAKEEASLRREKARDEAVSESKGLRRQVRELKRQLLDARSELTDAREVLAQANDTVANARGVSWLPEKYAEAYWGFAEQFSVFIKKYHLQLNLDSMLEQIAFYYASQTSDIYDYGDGHFVKSVDECYKQMQAFAGKPEVMQLLVRENFSDYEGTAEKRELVYQETGLLLSKTFVDFCRVCRKLDNEYLGAC